MSLCWESPDIIVYFDSSILTRLSISQEKILFSEKIDNQFEKCKMISVQNQIGMMFGCMGYKATVPADDPKKLPSLIMGYHPYLLTFNFATKETNLEEFSQPIPIIAFGVCNGTRLAGRWHSVDDYFRVLIVDKEKNILVLFLNVPRLILKTKLV